MHTARAWPTPARAHAGSCLVAKLNMWSMSFARLLQLSTQPRAAVSIAFRSDGCFPIASKFSCIARGASVLRLWRWWACACRESQCVILWMSHVGAHRATMQRKGMLAAQCSGAADPIWFGSGCVLKAVLLWLAHAAATIAISMQCRGTRFARRCNG